MKTILLLLVFTSVSVKAESIDDGHNSVEDCDGSLQLGDINLITTTEIVTDETHKTKGLQVMGCGYWMVYERKLTSPNRGAEACLDASHGRMSLNDIGLVRVKSVYRRETPCPKIATPNVLVIVCVVLVILAVLIVTIVVVRRYRVRKGQAETHAMESATIGQ